MSAHPIAGLSEIVGGFDAILFDQYGVLHDGRTAFSGAREAARRARDTGLRVAVLSNSGKRAAANAERLARLGFPSDLFDAVLTSGEACRARLAEDLESGLLAEGAGLVVVARGGEDAALEGLPLRLAETPAEAALVLIAGREPERVSFAQDVARLGPLAARGVPAFCANPDATMYGENGAAPGPGALAKAYAAAGGPVTWFGKPHRPIFEAALAALGDPDPGRVLMVGDSPEHDVAGAQAVGCATLLVTEGVQAGAAAAVGPDFTIPRLVW